MREVRKLELGRHSAVIAASVAVTAECAKFLLNGWTGQSYHKASWLLSGVFHSIVPVNKAEGLSLRDLCQPGVRRTRPVDNETKDGRCHHRTLKLRIKHTR